jgi:hypothetical protein
VIYGDLSRRKSLVSPSIIDLRIYTAAIVVTGILRSIVGSISQEIRSSISLIRSDNDLMEKAMIEIKAEVDINNITVVIMVAIIVVITVEAMEVMHQG